MILAHLINILWLVLLIQVFDISLGQIVRELLLFNIGNSVDVLELSLPIPVFIKQIVVAPKFLGNFSHKMKVLLGQESGNENVAVLLIEHLYPDKSLSRHDCLHEPEVETPDHNDSENNGEWSHNNPVLNVVDTEDRSVNRVINTIVVCICKARCRVNHCFIFVSVILLQERIKEKGCLSKRDQEDEKANISSDNCEELGRAQLFTLDIEMVVSTTILAVDFLGSDNLGSDAVGVMLLVLTVASFDILSVDSKKL
jgi:hypothetical protein